ncbi:MAG: hypothetical protein NXI20_21310 [bacterium]|nr:hypothetical protein [bacterium]
MRFRMAIIVILFMSPLIVFVLVFRNYEYTLPDGMAEVIYMVIGFGLFALLIRASTKTGRKQSED